MKPENFTQEELAEIGMKALSNNYGGDEYEAFNGSNDVSLDFHGQSVNLTEKVKPNVGFRCSVKNKLQRDITVVILPAYLVDVMSGVTSQIIVDESTRYIYQNLVIQLLAANGITADLILLDGIWLQKDVKPGEEEGDPDIVTYKEFARVTSNMPGKTVAGFIKFCQTNPTRIPEILIASNNLATYSEVIRIKQISPARDLGEKTIYLSEYFDQNANRVDYITVPTNNFGQSGLQFDDQTLIVMNIPAATDTADTTVDFTFKFGVSANKASELATKASIAKSETPVMVKKSMINVPQIKATLSL